MKAEDYVLSSDSIRNEVIRRLQKIPCDGKMKITFSSTGGQRTSQQNKALHKYCELLAEALNEAGYDMKKTLKPEIDIPWNKDTVKEYIWKPVQKALIGKESTTEMTKLDPGQVYEVLNRHISEKFGVFVPFPSEE